MKGVTLSKALERLSKQEEAIKDATSKNSEVGQKVESLGRDLLKLPPMLERLDAVEQGVKSRQDDNKREQLKVCLLCQFLKTKD